MESRLDKPAVKRYGKRSMSLGINNTTPFQSPANFKTIHEDPNA